jgi:FkbM family methyltransferase
MGVLCVPATPKIGAAARSRAEPLRHSRVSIVVLRLVSRGRSIVLDVDRRRFYCLPANKMGDAMELGVGTIRSGRDVFGLSKWGPFDLLSKLEPGLIVDAGAAAGHFTRTALAASPGSTALAFEPFPGNWSLLEKTLAGTPSKIVRAALGDKQGKSRFFVESATKTDGYSSLGYIVKPDSVLARVQHLVRRVRSPKGQMFTVPVTTIDEHVSERILFMKIDVQGSELRVLEGAARAFELGVDVLQIEFGGERDVLDFLFDRDYVVFDSAYNLMARFLNPDEATWSLVGNSTLTTGRSVYLGWPRSTPSDPDAYCDFFVEATPENWSCLDRSHRHSSGRCGTRGVPLAASRSLRFSKSSALEELRGL